jgi:tetratricopeptide (TPR) repeat protein
MEMLFCGACGAANIPDKDACEHCNASLSVARQKQGEAREHYQRALSLLEEQAIDDAILAVEAAIKLSPHTPAFHNLLGTIYARRGLYDLAQAEWRNALLAHPDQAEAWRNIEKAQELEETRYLQRIQRRPWRIVVALLSVLLVVALAAAIMMTRQALDLREQLAAAQGQRPDATGSGVQQLQQELEEARKALLVKDRELEKLRAQARQLEESWTIELALKQQEVEKLVVALDDLKRRALASVDPTTATGAARLRELGVEPGARVPLAQVPGSTGEPVLPGVGLVGPGEEPPPPPAEQNDCDAMLAQAQAALEQGNLARAEELINECLALDGRNNKARQLYREIQRQR